MEDQRTGASHSLQADSQDSLRTDEALVTDYQADLPAPTSVGTQAGEQSALDVLYRRYYNQIGFYIRKQSSYKDPSFIDDVRQMVFLKVFTIFKAGKFQPIGPGSFRSFLYETARRICFDQNEKRMRHDRPASEIFTDEELSTPDELCYRQPETTDYDEINERVKEVLSKLTPEEQKLMWLVSKKIPYKKIILEPEFKKYSIDYLMLKVYNIKKKFISSRPRKLSGFGGKGGKKYGKEE
jgi:RNA polymerase sigma factor (sigma-70 family)